MAGEDRWITEERLDALLAEGRESLLRQAKAALEEGREVMPTVVLFDPHGNAEMLLLPHGGLEGK